MSFVVTGAAGMLGRDVVAAAVRGGHEVHALSRRELDVTDPSACRRVLEALSPAAVVHCAAWTDVDGAEEHEAQATRLNGEAAGNVAAAAAAVGAHIVHVSSDYVFDGTASRPYVESSPTAPLSAYGRSKLAGEHAVAAAALDGHALVRTSWLFGPHGRNFVATMLRLAGERDTVTVVDDQVGCPTYSGHLAEALVDVADRRLPGVVHVAGEGSCSWWELARETFAQAGIDCRVEPASTDDVPRPAARPRFSVLGTERPDAPRLPHWREGLAEYLSVGVAL
jgi:dTDP-4-dehydrorhamnose reductase